MDAGIVVKVEDYDGMCKCLFCGPSVRGQPALKIDTASLSARSHRPGVRGGSRCRGGCTDRGCGSGGRGARGRRHLGRGKCGCGGSTGGANRSRKGQQRQGQGACGGRRRPGFWRRGRGDEHGSWCGWRRRRRQGQGSRGRWLSRGLQGEERYGLQRRRKAGRGLGAPEMGLAGRAAVSGRRLTKTSARQRSTCKECGGSSICQHARQRSTCKECGGASICQHLRIRRRCKTCKADMD